MTYRWAAGLIAMTTSACSFGMTKGVQDGWTVEQKPECTRDPTGPLLDVFAAAGAIGLAGAAEQDHPGGNVAGVAILVAIPYTIAALVGEERVRSCREASQLYQLNEVAHHVGTPKPVAAPPVPPPPMSPFYCYASPVDGNLGACARTAAWCSEVRDHEAPDLGPCTPVRVASCFHYTNAVGVHDVCGPTTPTCNHRRDAVLALGSSVSDVGECQETK